MENFQHLGLPESLVQALDAMQFLTPTPIQAETIPLALQGSDILGSAQTGTGKTGAFGIPLVAHLLNNPQSTALVLTPTRELALQVLQALKSILGKKSNMNTGLLIGGESIFKQLTNLKNRPRLIVGTPGRVNDHLCRRTLDLSRTTFVVFDETDRMLDMGFSIQIQEIVKYLPEKRQTLMFSATMAPNIMKTAQSYLKNPERIAVGSTTAPAKKIKQEVVRTTESEKYPLLLKRLDEEAGSCIIFVKTKMGTENLAHKLREQGHDADAIHGDLKQRNRDQVIRSFRNGKNRILVATDVAARGLDIPHIECVINYDLPQCPEDYIHRIGRTGRAGAEGKAVSLITSQDGSKWRLIHKLINPNEPMEPFPSNRGGDSGFRKKNRSFQSRDGDRREGRPFGGGDRESRPFGGGERRESRPFGGGDREARPFAGGDRREARPFPGGDKREGRPFGGGDREARPFAGGDRREARPFPGGDKREGRSFGGGDREARPFAGGDRREARPFPGGDKREGRPFGGGDRESRPFAGGGERREGRPFSGGDKRESRPSQGPARGKFFKKRFA